MSASNSTEEAERPDNINCARCGVVVEPYHYQSRAKTRWLPPGTLVSEGDLRPDGWRELRALVQWQAQPLDFEPLFLALAEWEQFIDQRVCSDCKQALEDSKSRIGRAHGARHSLARSLNAAGIPPALQRVSLVDAWTEAASDEELVARLEEVGDRPGRLLVPHDFRGVFHKLRGWNPAPEHGLFIHGTVGTGKTTLAAAIVGDYLRRIAFGRFDWAPEFEPAPSRAQSPLEQRTGSAPHALMVSERRLLEMEMDFKYLASELADSGAPTLFLLDDVGSAGSYTDRQRTALETLLEFLVTHDVCCIFTSNLSVSRLGEVAGHRIASRALALTRNGLIEVDGFNWRFRARR